MAENTTFFKSSPESDIAEILISGEEIQKRVTEIAAQIDEYYANSPNNLILLGILKGSVVFLSDLMKKIKSPVEIDFMKVSSYSSGSVSSGTVTIILDIHRQDFNKCDILIIEDIIDSGRTLSYLTNYLKLKGAASVHTCTLLDKPSRREVDFTPDFCGFEIPDKFVVGYGLDYNEKYRALPYVGVLRDELYKN
ncbi:MAG: hypoxanthine phosphoribosyltransferase [Clostridiales bacterium]|nr:hypoxanthine phosphoribosyltransferase [Clostridiales bacterium]